MSNRVTKAQLQDEVERLRAHADRLEAELAVLRDKRQYLADEVRAGHSACRSYEACLLEAGQQLAGMAGLIEHWAGLHQAAWINTEYGEFMRLAREGFEQRASGRTDVKYAALPSVRVNRALSAKRVVYEFNPSVKGDYERAMRLARENNGIVRRAKEGATA